MSVLAFDTYKNNAELILACRTLGYLADDYHTLDPTWGRGTFWKLWQPLSLVRHDLKLDGVDFTALPHPNDEFDAITFDPPYKLNGTPATDIDVDERYGVDVVRTWQERHELILDGIDECARVLKPGGWLLIKCQDQVCSGQVRWQTREFADHAEDHGLRLVDQLHIQSYRPQPAGRRQIHARRNYSTMLVLR